MMKSIFVFLTICAISVSSFRTPISTRARILVKREALSDISVAIAAASEAVAKPDGYVYGAVAAPGWALPVGAVLVILTAALPILLRPGEQV